MIKIHAQKKTQKTTHTKKGDFSFHLDDGVENVADISLSVGVLATFLTPNVLCFFFFHLKTKKYRIKCLHLDKKKNYNRKISDSSKFCICFLKFFNFRFSVNRK